MAKKKYFNLTTPPGTAAFAYLREPDSKGQYADDKYKTTLLIPKSVDIDYMRRVCLEAAAAEWPDLDPAEVVLPFKDGDDMAEKYENFAGHHVLTAKSQKAPSIFDTRKNVLPPSVKVFGGDTVRLSLSAAPYTKTEKVKDGKKLIDVTVHGVTLHLFQVQLIRKNANGGGAGFDDYDGADGYVYEPDDGPSDNRSGDHGGADDGDF